MRDEDGMCRPQAERSDISTQPSDEEKIQFIDNLFNTILKRSISRANFSDLRMELVDHYVAELGDDFFISDREEFEQRVYGYHQKFGGPKRISKIADNFFQAKHQLINKQFRSWMLRYWPIHLLIIPIAIILSYSVDVMTQTCVMLITTIAVVIVEGYKYHQDRDLRRRFKQGHSSVNFFYQYKLQVLLMLTLPFNFLSILDLVDAKWLCAFIFPFVYYICGCGYYYHLKVCQRRIAPLLEQYKAQLITQPVIA